MSDTPSNMHTHNIAQALAQVRARIEAVAVRAQRKPSEITLVAVSKTFPAAAVAAASAAGQMDFGENRVEEAVPKIEQVNSLTPQAHIRWHLIGHVQSRKVRDVHGHFALIHSVDTLKLATLLNQRVAQQDAPVAQPVLLECNVSGEESKSGFALAGWQHDPRVLDAFCRDVEQISALPHVSVRGLMMMAPVVEQPEQARPYFASLRNLRDALRQRFPHIAWEHLSMGMSDDFEAAILEGATMVRIGRAIFGERPTH
jgi:pyridoxal phosphate enzyme (YggS family)